MNYHRATVITLLCISIIGLIAIPFGNPKLIYGSLALELSFIILTYLVWKESSKALYACIPVGFIVIIGNSLAPPHVHLMTTFEKPINAVVTDRRWYAAARIVDSIRFEGNNGEALNPCVKFQ